jgi:hypothetical protein
MSMKPTNPRPRAFPDRLFFSPLAWLKLQWFCHAGHTEVGGFGISAEHNPLYVEDLAIVKQYATPVTVRFDDDAVAELFARLWIHTHPGDSAQPSGTDEETFARTFGACDWAVMFIVNRSAQTYARLSFSAGPGGQVLLPTAVHWTDLPKLLARTSLDDHLEQWRKEYATNVVEQVQAMLAGPQEPGQEWWDRDPWSGELDGTVYEPTYSGADDEFPF